MSDREIVSLLGTISNKLDTVITYLDHMDDHLVEIWRNTGGEE